MRFRSFFRGDTMSLAQPLTTVASRMRGRMGIQQMSMVSSVDGYLWVGAAQLSIFASRTD